MNQLEGFLGESDKPNGSNNGHTINSIQSKKIQPPVDSWDKKEYMQGQPSTIMLKASMKDHITSRFQASKERLGEISHMYMPITSISSRIQNF